MNKILMIGMLIFGMVAVANAGPVLNQTSPGVYTDKFDDGTSYGYYTNSGTYLGTFLGNDTSHFLDTVKSNLLSAGYDVNLVQASVSYTTTNEVTGVILGTYTGGDDATSKSRTGTWTALPAPETTISFYSVKAGRYYSLFAVNPAAGSGSWSTYNMWQYGVDNSINGIGGNEGLEISHFSGFNPGTISVPEPAGLFVFGTGLVGLVAVARRRNKK